jgi:TfoX/Sxy family transcriptional regulator of competence genes
MPYDEALAERIRAVVGRLPDIMEKKMFGGLAFLQDGKMFCGIVNSDLMVRVGPDRYEESLAKQHARPMDFTGRPMNGYVFVGSRGCRTEQDVRTWVELGAAFVATLRDQPKDKGTRRKSNRKQPRRR